MKQSVNLYPLELRSGDVKFSARQIAGLAGVLVIVLALVSAFQGFANYRSEAELTRVQNEANDLNIKLDTLRATHDVSKKRQQLDQSKLVLKEKVLAQEKVLTLLKGEGANLEGFSSFLYGLARQHEPGLWLEEFSLSSGGEVAAFQGKSVKPDLVFSYLDKLGREPSYQGKKFSTLSLLQDSEDKALMVFEVRSEPSVHLAAGGNIENQNEEDEDD